MKATRKKKVTKKVINCVYSKNKLDFKRYTKSINTDDIISYHDVITKLVKNDLDNDRPSQLVINSYIRRKIIKAITDNDITKILYALKNLDLDTIQHIKELISDFYKDDIEYNLIIIKNKRLDIQIDEAFSKEFKKVLYKSIPNSSQ